MNEVIVDCARPAGCGWWWIRRTERRRWPRRPRITWYGPYWDGDGGPGGAPRWHTDEQFRDNYSDCIRHLRVRAS